MKCLCIATDGAADFELVRAAVAGVRQVRSDYAVPPSAWVEATIVAAPHTRALFDDEAALVGRLARSHVAVADTAPSGAAAHVVLGGGAELVVPLAGMVDVEKECAKLAKELAELEKQLGALRGRLANEGFVSRAPAAVVDAERQKERDWSARRDQIAEKVASLCGGR